MPSPRIFRLWTAIHAVGAAVERRVWTPLTGNNRMHPNLFLFLVGPAASGKTQALSPMESILRKSRAVTVAPNDITKEAFLDCLAESAKAPLINGRPYDYHFLALHVRELSNFMSQYDGSLAGLMTDLFDCPPMNEEKKRTHNKGKELIRPGLSFVMGTTPQQLGTTISEELWGSGFMARVVMIYSAEFIIPVNLFAPSPDSSEQTEELILSFKRLGNMFGEMSWEPAAQKILQTFAENQLRGGPTHNRLTLYTSRRWMQIAKLSMISAISDERMLVEKEDILVAKEWLAEAEGFMPEIFRDMQSHEDGQIHEELRGVMFAAYVASHKKPVPASLIYQWLAKRVASHAVERTFQIALAAEYFHRVAGSDDLYIPQAPPGHKDLGVF